jgi:hypothetical protein
LAAGAVAVTGADDGDEDEDEDEDDDGAGVGRPGTVAAMTRPACVLAPVVIS